MVKTIQATKTHPDVNETTKLPDGGNDHPDFWDALMSVIHDLRNSLGAMKGYATLMIEDLKSGDEKYNCTKKILDCIEKVEKLFQDIQTVARSGKVQFEYVELKKIFNRNIRAYQATEHHHEMKIVERYPQKALTIKCSAHMFSRMVNILLNEMASYYEKLNVHVTEVRGENVRITFEGFVKLDEEAELLLGVDNYKMKKTMNDVSFLIVKKIVEIHNGEIRFDVDDNLCEKYMIEIPIVQRKNV